MTGRPVLAFAAVAFAAAAQTPAFEAASVKRHTDPEPRIALQILPSGRVHMVNLPLYVIIALAYEVPFQSQTERLSGGPDWARSETYDIEATAGSFPPETTSAARIRTMKLMLRALLADRFHLQTRHETKEMPVYTLTVAKDGPKLTPAKMAEQDCLTTAAGAACHEARGGIGRGLHGTALTIGDLAYAAQNWSDRPIIDRTGLTGLYSIDTDGWVPMESRPPAADGAAPSAEALAMADPARPTLFVIMSRLGLRVEPAKGPVEVYVIERVERPAAN